MYRRIAHLLLILALAVPPLQAGAVVPASSAAPVPAMPCHQGMQDTGAHAGGTAAWHDCCKQKTDCCHRGDGCQYSASDCGCQMIHAGASAPAGTAVGAGIRFTTAYDSIPTRIVATRAVCPLLRPPRPAA